jgi:type IV secretion system protein TrbB
MATDTAESRLIEKLKIELAAVWNEAGDTRRGQVANLVGLIEIDQALIEIMINPDGSVWIERQGMPMECLGHKDPWEVEAILGTVATAMGRVINRDHPIIEGELPIGGCRIEGMLPPLVSAPCLTIRVPAKRIYTLPDYFAAGSITQRQASVLANAVSRKDNILIAGGTGSGKTTLANALINQIHESERCILIEDTLELQCSGSNVIQMHTSVDVDLRKLVRATMRMRPDRIVVGEVRGAEALDLLKSLNSGHPGGITTIHANDCRSALWKLDGYVQEAGVGPQRELIAQAIQLVVLIEKTTEGRRITEMQRVKGYNGVDFDLTSVSEETGR